MLHVRSRGNTETGSGNTHLSMCRAFILIRISMYSPRDLTSVLSGEHRGAFENSAGTFIARSKLNLNKYWRELLCHRNSFLPFIYLLVLKFSSYLPVGSIGVCIQTIHSPTTTRFLRDIAHDKYQMINNCRHRSFLRAYLSCWSKYNTLNSECIL